MSSTIIVTFVSFIPSRATSDDQSALIPCRRSGMVNLQTTWCALSSQVDYLLPSFMRTWQKSVWAGWKDAPLSNHGMCRAEAIRSCFLNLTYPLYPRHERMFLALCLKPCVLTLDMVASAASARPWQILRGYPLHCYSRIRPKARFHNCSGSI